MNKADGQHPREALQDLLDGRLDGQARGDVVAHIASCSACASELEILRWTRSTAATAFAAGPVPESLERSIQAALDREEHPSRPKRDSWLTRIRRPALAFAVLTLVVLAVGIVLMSRRGDVPARVASDYAAYRTGAIDLDLKTADVVELERFFAQKGIAFQTRVLDLGMMAHRLVGGRVHRIRSLQSVLFVYAGPAGQVLVCQMYKGSVADLPAAEKIRQHGGIEFHAYVRDGTTLVFWQEGAVVCVLAGDGATEEVLKLAFAKAMKV
jgi:anti-sigma factor RsiW